MASRPLSLGARQAVKYGKKEVQEGGKVKHVLDESFSYVTDPTNRVGITGFFKASRGSSPGGTPSSAPVRTGRGGGARETSSAARDAERGRSRYRRSLARRARKTE